MKKGGQEGRREGGTGDNGRAGVNEDEHAAAHSVELRSGPCVWQCAHRLVLIACPNPWDRLTSENIVHLL